MNAPEFIRALEDPDGGAVIRAQDYPVGIMLRAPGGEWEFSETPKPRLRYDHKSGKPLLILGRVEGTISKP